MLHYSPENISDPFKRMLAIAAAHHRLGWIHPFQDGNGRVMRLFSEAYIITENLDAHGLWSISRGLSFYKQDYYSTLSNADNPRLSDNDGRGSLSDRFLKEFCIFFLRTAIDQIQFMRSLFETDSILKRIDSFVELMSLRDELKPESKYVLRKVFLEGQISKGEIMLLTGKSDNVARAIMRDLLERELLKTENESIKSKLRINFPVKYAPYIFPKLYPPDVEATMIS